MNKDKAVYQTIPLKNNGLSAAQEVHYQRDFKRADKAKKN